MKTVKYSVYKMIYKYFLEIMSNNDEEVARVRNWLSNNETK